MMYPYDLLGQKSLTSYSSSELLDALLLKLSMEEMAGRVKRDPSLMAQDARFNVVHCELTPVKPRPWWKFWGKR